MTVTVLIKRVQDPQIIEFVDDSCEALGDPESINEIPLTKMKM